jgi:hypothetical protein
VDADRYLRRKRAFIDLPIDSRARQPGAIEDGFEADDTVWFWHGLNSISWRLMTPPAMKIDPILPIEKSFFGASKCGVEEVANGGSGAFRTFGIEITKNCTIKAIAERH